jgi:hypothetical protein
VTGYPDRFFAVFLRPSRQMLEQRLKLVHYRFLPQHFKLITHLSSLHSTLYSLSYWKSVVKQITKILTCGHNLKPICLRWTLYREVYSFLSFNLVGWVHKATLAPRPFSFIARPYLISNHSWFVHQNSRPLTIYI